MSVDSPVLFIIFNRLETTKRVLTAIKRAKPKRLYIASDGGRNETEKGLVDDIREYVISEIGWDCNVKTLFREENWGCGQNVSDSISWFFNEEEQGIILEDDCVPSDSFFEFCDELLLKYKYDTRICQINGNNFGLTDFVLSEWDYHFCHYPQAWGWASWRRAWKDYSLLVSPDRIPRNINSYKHLGWKKSDIKLQIHNWVRAGRSLDTWDYQWQYINQIQGNLAVVPKRNLISNIGDIGTHFSSNDKRTFHLKAEEMNMPLKHPEFILIDSLIGRSYKKRMIKNSIKNRIVRFIGVSNFEFGKKLLGRG